MEYLLPFSASVEVRSRGYLTHWEVDEAIYFITYRLADSLPRSLVFELKRELDAIKRQIAGDDEPDSMQRAEIRRRFFHRFDADLDAGLGECHLKHPEIAECVVGGWRKFDQERYRLIAWCVMPNHAHVIIHLTRGADLAKVIHSWKSYTANVANGVLGRKGRFWYRDYFDHCIRSEGELERTARYVLDNPLKIGLSNWPYVGCAGW